MSYFYNLSQYVGKPDIISLYLLNHNLTAT